ncbi:MAG: class I SAM-dependent methyltransferase [Candidatus Eisenbacteria bacterium]|uniref:Class I SAM-dependent methyltransferase n=1 Tax=Eiseniibacteriota bacterium TaxID=2212470 RepID=A0A948RVE2_UNCEI|nr:class I SAM-dependent methyltransferase [Candidatus Eisenbacteria bacterium]MBU1947509.1 class I SAM-dependent methyltransferase [Candidatus Eisenbacteria bacterium]MBU2691730.1 class I SAM-dependent methyltransferase [Candidatus Eisenbacteria bacterium]
MKRDDYTAFNRKAWNQAEPIHRKQNFERLLQDFKKAGYNQLDKTATELLQAIGLAGKSVAQVCCNNGRELLSVKNLGAKRCTGFDISERFIAQARELADAGGIDCEFVSCDAYHVPSQYNESFDLVFCTVGTLGWMPELDKFFDVVKRLLVSNGRLFLYEMHPILDMFDPEESKDPLQIRHSYFRKEPFADTTGLDYYGHERYESVPQYWFPHTMAEILSLCLRGGFRLEAFREYDHDISNAYAHFEKFDARPPLSYSLTAVLEKENSDSRNSGRK